MLKRFVNLRSLSFVIAALLLIALPAALSDFQISLLGRFLSYAIVALGLDLLWGYTGMLSLGQGLFFGRWLIQWIVSERQAESRMPIAFWYLSLVGGLITLAYAIYRRDPVFIAGQSIGALVYIRNLMLIHRQGPQPASSSVASAGKPQ